MDPTPNNEPVSTTSEAMVVDKPQPTDPPRPQLAQVSKRAFWHPETKLIVSPMGRPLPLKIGHQVSTNFTEPRILTDSNIYLAWYPRRGIAYGLLFQFVDIGDDELGRHIYEASDRLYYLEDDIVATWSSLEFTLFDFAKSLYEIHPFHHEMPFIDYPHLPEDFGYTRGHRDHHKAVKAAIASRKAFRMLVALSTFALSLWLTSDVETCFDAAFEALQKKQPTPFAPATLQLIKDSAVCKFEFGFRPGGFLKGFSTNWGPVIHRFGRAGVSIWLLWGDPDTSPFTERKGDLIFQWYYPPDHHISLAKKALSYENLTIVRPHPQTYHPPSAFLEDASTSVTQPAVVDEQVDNEQLTSSFNEPTDDTAALNAVEPGSLQRPGETRLDFFDRMRKDYESATEMEATRVRIRRLESEASAFRELDDGPRKVKRRPATYYVWEPSPTNAEFLIRRRCEDWISVVNAWKKTPRESRKYWSHINQWDLFPSAATDEEQSREAEQDEGEEGVVSSTREIVKKDILEHIENSPDTYTIDDSLLNPIDFDKFLTLVHGFTRSLIQHGESVCHGKKPMEMTNANGERVKHMFGFREEKMEKDLAPSCVDFLNTCIAAPSEISLSNLPATRWDFVGLKMPRRYIRVDLATAMKEAVRAISAPSALDKDKPPPLYLLRSNENNEDDSKWLIAVTDPNSVLLVYRMGLQSLYHVAEIFLNWGIPFRTAMVREATSYKQPERRSVGGQAPLCDVDFKPTKADYIAYLTRREAILQSPRGRAARMRGGIVGRIAAEVVEEGCVLTGPQLEDEIIGYDSQGNFLVDDYISQVDVDIICGQYRERNREISGKLSSWWPSEQVWNTRCGWQVGLWAPESEGWYVNRRKSLTNGDFDVFPAIHWKDKYKHFRPKTGPAIVGSRFMAELFLKDKLNKSNR